MWKQFEKRIGSAWQGRGRPPAGAYTVKMAEAALDALVVDLRRGVGIPTAGTGATFADAAVEWYRWGCNERAWKPATRRDYRSALSAHLGVDLDADGQLVAVRAPFGDLPLERITTDVIERWRRNAMAVKSRREQPQLAGLLCCDGELLLDCVVEGRISVGMHPDRS